MNAEEYRERELQLAGWPVKVTSYKLGSTYYVTVDNVSPGAWVVKAQGPNRDAAERQALKDAEAKLAEIKRTKPPTGCTSVPGF